MSNKLSTITSRALYKAVNLIAFKEKAENSNSTPAKLENDLGTILTKAVEEIAGSGFPPSGGASNFEDVTVGESVVAGDLLYLNSDGKYWKADYLDDTRIDTELRYAKEAIAANGTGEAYIFGMVPATGLTVGDIYYVGANGTITNNVPDIEGIFLRKVGTASSTTTLEFYPDSDYYQTTLTDDGLTTFSEIVYVNSKSQLPSPISGVITLEDNTLYDVLSTIDLEGDRIVMGENTTIRGFNRVSCKIKSTGLTGFATVSGVKACKIHGVTIEGDICVDFDGTGTTNAGLVFEMTSLLGNSVGTIHNFSTVQFDTATLVGTIGLNCTGTFSSITADSVLGLLYAGTGTIITVDNSATISNRFRMTNSTLIVGSGQTGINFSNSVSIGDERYILQGVSFLGAGTYLSGVNHTSNKALFVLNTGITNSYSLGEMNMNSNATVTAATANTWIKAAGLTVVGGCNNKFTHTSNRLTCSDSFSGFRKAKADFSVVCSVNNTNVDVGFSKNGAAPTVWTPVECRTSSGKYAGSVSACFLIGNGDYIEVWVRPATNSNVTLSSVNVMVEKISE